MMETQPETTLIELIRYNNWANAADPQRLPEAHPRTARHSCTGRLRQHPSHRGSHRRGRSRLYWADDRKRSAAAVPVGRRASCGRDRSFCQPGSRCAPRRGPAHFAHPPRPRKGGRQHHGLPGQASFHSDHQPRHRTPHQHHDHPQQSRSPIPRSGWLGLPHFASGSV